MNINLVDSSEHSLSSSRENMECKVADQEKSSRPRRDHCLRPSRGAINQKTAVANILEALARVSNGQEEIAFDRCESGVTRMKIVVKKEHLKQVVEVMRSDGKSICIANCHSSPSPVFTARPSNSTSSLEQRLNVMRKRHLSRSNQTTKKGSRQQIRSSWKPALYSIPE